MPTPTAPDTHANPVVPVAPADVVARAGDVIRPALAPERGRRRHLLRSGAVIATVAALVACAAAGSHAPALAQDTPCADDETAVVVDAARHRLFLCERGDAKHAFDVSLGSGGLGKRHVGDNKTPLGAYALGPPRGSADFHVFVPVGYPTPDQTRAGFSGSAIGIHGPPRGFPPALARPALLSLDWTAGCIAVGTDADIDAIAAWLRTKNVKRVRVLPDGAAGAPH